ncbi:MULTISPECIES: ROK family transcriptional regulator [Mesorhizobium]|uniref:ROK family transcriptional regulator n=1 Tax=Mesorhizobium denitrificans TaxID=2294114 RepID=A0A371XI99_9HYPH|nr:MULTISPECIES: ROK family transcriptional regulator [Mesorhizobium]RFC68939.1 ROK family transcriptional regulator [Mesorhizobium denitrificans]
MAALSANELKALSEIFLAGAISRAELARRLDITRSTTGLIVQSLVQTGLVRERDASDGEGDDTEARVGRPGILIETAGTDIFFLGSYIAVNSIMVVGVDLSGTIRTQSVRPFRGAGSDPVAAISVLAELVHETRAGLGSNARVLGLNVAVPGFVSSKDFVYHAAILGWHDVDVVKMVERELGNDRLPVFVENDANAVALAEAYHGETAAGVGDTLVVLIENGVGGGIVSDGRLYRGQFSGAGEIGHMPVGPEGFVYDAKRPGRFETYIGKDALLSRYAHIGGQGATLDGYLRALGEREPAAMSAARDWAHWLARGLAILSSVLQPGRIVLAGSVSAVFPFVQEQVGTQLASALVEGYPAPTIGLSGIGANGAAVGAALVLHQMALGGDPRFELRPQADDLEGTFYARQG